MFNPSEWQLDAVLVIVHLLTFSIGKRALLFVDALSLNDESPCAARISFQART